MIGKRVTAVTTPWSRKLTVAPLLQTRIGVMNTPTDAVLPVADEGQPVPANGQNSAMQRLAGLSQNDYVASCSHYPAGTPLDRTFRCLCLLKSVPT